MGIGRGVGPNGVHRQLGLRQLERTLGGSDQHQDAFCAREVDAFEQRASHRLLCRNAGAVRPFGHRGAHHGLAGLAHHRAHIFKVNVHMAWHINDFRNAAHGVFQHIVGVAKGLVLTHFVAQHFQQFFIQHHNQRVDVGLEFGQADIGIGHATTPFKVKRLGHHAHRQNSHFLGDAGDHRRRTGTGTTAHASRDK